MAWRRLGALVMIFVAFSAGGRSAADPGVVTPGLVDVGPGRSLFLDCQGSGEPTVFVIPGLGSYAEVWNVVIPAGDPVWFTPYDDIELATPIASPEAVQPSVARRTRVCVYDRPSTRPDGAQRSTPVPQPHSAQQDVEDVVALIDAAGLPGPLVFAAHSYGGLVLDLLARRHPDLVAGMVFVEPTSEFLTHLGSAAQNAAFFADARERGPGAEGILMEQSFAEIDAAPPLPEVPTAVLSGDRFPAPERLSPDNYTKAQILQANGMLAAMLGASNQIVAGSGHNMMLYQPGVVADAILGIVDRARGSGG
ncbi:pimeloyl-ACP methyl ester carboxylesterase [Mycolicibacterium iranicum]|uniref:Pimeloyl-ACP methyl ester carboxylesterase n=1 Tax=Mycolicibacterium iranicum TaxID=912594 RepID=A0A839Q659_MYCIR|nr:alpha/beta hydrolase [Mycolicibacterium iranicum]MBB2990364.1 pimeloyl-ACP methyl ester carboxylesterase [Mycolicibacterium iranicum]